MRNFKLFFITIWVFCFFLTSCNKDEILESDKNSFIESRTATVEGFSSFENEFYRQKSGYSIGCQSKIHPLAYNLDMPSARYTNFFGNPSVIVNVQNSSVAINKWVKNQVLISKLENEEYVISSLIYLADSSYYIQNGYKPLLINFTGTLVQFCPKDSLFKTFSFVDGNSGNDENIDDGGTFAKKI